MAGKSLYEILELSSNASPESIRAAYERLSARFDPDQLENAGKPDIKLQSEAIKEAFLMLGNPATRAQYDKKLAVRNQPPLQNIEVVEAFWTTPKIIVVAVVAIIGGTYYYKHSKEEARHAAEKTIATAKAKEAEEKAKAEAVQAQFELARQRDSQRVEDQQRHERDAALRQFSADQRVVQSSERTRAQQERTEQLRQQREEAQAAAAARQQAARDKAELCRLERERYGRAISC
jgi:curved DNA-binding protein CbpA